jgi:hypothetical protein
VERRLVLRRSRFAVHDVVSRGRVRRGRLRGYYLRSDPQGHLGPDRTVRGHGCQSHRGGRVFPEHPSPLLRTDVLRAGGQGAGPAVRAGLQRLDDRRVVGRRRQGTPAWLPTRSAAAPPRALSPSPSRKTRIPSDCPRSTTRTGSGIPSSPPAKRPARWCACTSGRHRRCRRLRPTLPS